MGWRPPSVQTQERSISLVLLLAEYYLTADTPQVTSWLHSRLAPWAAFPRDKLCTFEIFPNKNATFSKLWWQVLHIWDLSKQKNLTFLNFQTATAPGQSSCNIQTRVPMSTDSSNEFSQTTEPSFCSFEYRPPATYLKVSQNYQILYLYECSLKCDRSYICMKFYSWQVQDMRSLL